MSWIQKLHATYDACMAAALTRSARPWAMGHIEKKTHVEVTLDQNGAFRRARKLGRDEALTLIPATESSAGRTAGDAPHPLCEELGYCAGDLPGVDPDRFALYVEQLEKWAGSAQSSQKLRPILIYVKAKRIWQDLLAEKLVPATTEDGKGNKTKVADEKVFVRWRVECPGQEASGTWDDDHLIEAWQKFDALQNTKAGYCMVTGTASRLSQNHPRFIRYSSDGGKLISANDFNGYTFRGRFTDVKTSYEKQVCSVGFEVSQRAHSALRWLIKHQGHQSNDQAFVAWEITGKPVPDPFHSTFDLFEIRAVDGAQTSAPVNTGQAFALKLKSAIAGYRAKLDPKDEVVVLGLDSATPGRMAITYYRELRGSEFLDRIEAWHQQFAWPQNFGKERSFIGAPAPPDIAEAAYGTNPAESLRKATVERLLPCIVDGVPLPLDLLSSATRRATNRIGFDRSKDKGEQAWKKCLGIACALFKGYHTERNYLMSLETDRTNRDYLFGRLLAIAEDIESYALYVANENGRDTSAARLMQRFADRPASTWRTIELSLRPYMTRLRNLRPGVLYKKEKLLDEVTGLFKPDDFLRDAALTGEFLLGYHCQRQALALRPPDDTAEKDEYSTDTLN